LLASRSPGSDGVLIMIKANLVAGYRDS
jgi:hypothetical protein